MHYYIASGALMSKFEAGNLQEELMHVLEALGAILVKPDRSVSKRVSPGRGGETGAWWVGRERNRGVVSRPQFPCWWASKEGRHRNCDGMWRVVLFLARLGEVFNPATKVQL